MEMKPDSKTSPPVLNYQNRTVEITRNEIVRYASAVMHSMAIGFLVGGGFCLGVTLVALIAGWIGHGSSGHAGGMLLGVSVQFIAAGSAFGGVVGGLYGAAAQFK